MISAYASPSTFRPNLTLRLAFVALGTALLLLPAIINGFPFVFVDSADYVILTPRLYRSPFYQLFVFLTGLKISAWPVVVAQASICMTLVAITLYRTERLGWWNAGATLIALAVFSSLPIFADFLMPDIFTGVMFLAIYLLVFLWRRLSRVERSWAALAGAVAMAVHLSHLVMAAGVISACALAWCIPAARRWVSLGGVATAGVATAIAALLTVGYNQFVFKTPTLSPAGSSFFLANLLEEGPATAELRQTCPQAGYRICHYLDQLPHIANDFLWKPSPFRTLGGFAGMREESSQIVWATIRHRGGAVASASAASTARALISVAPATDLAPVSLADTVVPTIKKAYHRDAAALTGSLQEQGRFPVRAADDLTYVGLLAAIASVLAALALRPTSFSSDGITALVFMTIAFVGNAIVCATLSGVWNRYQSRVSWLLVFAALIVWLPRSRQHRHS